MNRRQFVRSATLGTFGLLSATAFAAKVPSLPDDLRYFKGKEIFDRIVQKAAAGKWQKLPIGELIGKIALELKGIPYVGFTLEVSLDTEYCVVNFAGLDCVTFFEDSLCLARMIKHGRKTPKDLVAEVIHTRYRRGKMGDFTTRLHYTTDWFVDNAQKGVVKILTPELPGAAAFTQKVGIMSHHPENYRQLKAHPEMVPVIRRIEDRINGRSLMYLPLAKIKAAEPLLQTGDIVGVTTTEQGIDIAHTGLCLRQPNGVVSFMNAASSDETMKVIIDPDLATCLDWSSKLTGVMIAQPREVT